MKISVCIPCYYSEKTLGIVVEQIQQEFRKRGAEYQLVLVNDGSTDGTWPLIQKLCSEDEHITGVNLSKNYGQPAAKLAALKYATGDAVVFMDDDGQHPAAGIFQLTEKLAEGYDVVYASFQHKQHSGLKKLTSNFHNRLAEKMGTKPKGVRRSSFVAWSRMVVDAVLEYQSPFVSIGSYLMTITSRFANVPMTHQKRIHGRSGYNFKKLMKMWMNLFISFSMLPLRMATYLGFVFSGAGFLGILYLLLRQLIRPIRVSGYASTMVVVLFVGGIVMIMLGIIGEYVGRTYMTVSNMPQYRIRETANAEADSKAGKGQP